MKYTHFINFLFEWKKIIGEECFVNKSVIKESRLGAQKLDYHQTKNQKVDLGILWNIEKVEVKYCGRILKELPLIKQTKAFPSVREFLSFVSFSLLK